MRTDNLSPAIQWIRSELPMARSLNAALARQVAERLTNESLKGILIEELSPAGEVKQVAGCGLSVFVSDETMDHYLQRQHPFFFFDLLDRAMADDSLVLSRRAIASANARQGLNLVVHYMQRGWDFADPHWRAVSTLGHTTYVAYHRGYQLRRAMQEDWTSVAEMYTSGGYRAVATLPLTNVTLVAPPLSDTRTLLYAEKDDLTQRAPSSTLAFVFEHHRPRLGLSASGQRILERALEGATDQEMAEQFGLSLTTIKHTWKRIYERVHATAPYLVGDEAEGRRGPEKRRRLLAYLSDHPEELRPYARTDKG